MPKTNFTKEHHEKLMGLAGNALFKGTIFKGNLGSEMRIHDLVHNCTVDTLSRHNVILKKQIAEIEEKDDWSLTPYQVQKANDLKKQQELIYLLIGFKRYNQEKAEEESELKALKKEYEKLKEDTKTPEQKMQEYEKKIAALEASGV